jgi:hypothetical protein
MKWNCNLMCQVQAWADKCEFKQSDSYHAAMPAAENMASGSDGELAAGMWFSEYGRSDEDKKADYGCCGHFTAMVWKSTKEFACGSCKANTEDDVYFCQYANSRPNFGGKDAFAENVKPFIGSASDFHDAMINSDHVYGQLSRLEALGFAIGDSLDRLSTNDIMESFNMESFSLRRPGGALHSPALTTILAGATVFGGMAVAFKLFSWQRQSRYARRQLLVAAADDQETQLIVTESFQ